MATVESLEARLVAVESELRKLKARLDEPQHANAWLRKIEGSFANDPVFDEIVRLGAEIRDNEPPAQDVLELED